MTAIFDKNSNLVAWFSEKNIFDLDLNWVAFLSSDNVFNSQNLNWLGPFNDGSFLDKEGKPVGWLSGSTPKGTMRPTKPLRPLKPLKPLNPLRPLKPLKPLKPLTPLGGWSKLSWDQWLNS